MKVIVPLVTLNMMPRRNNKRYTINKPRVKPISQKKYNFIENRNKKQISLINKATVKFRIG
jgi:hypothetical protein